MHDDRSLIEERLARVLRERIVPAIYPQSVPLEAEVWVAPGEPVPVAEGLSAGPRAPIAAGDAWGAPWATNWITVRGTVPAAWAGRTVEAILDLGFDPNKPGFQCEGLVYRPDGSPVKGINPNNQWVRVADEAAGGEQVALHIEAAANPCVLDYQPFVPTELGELATAGDEPQYRIARLDLAVFDETVWNLVLDLEVLGELMAELPLEGARRWEILRAVDRALDAVDLQDVNGSAAAARAELAEVLAAPAVPSAHRIAAIGHAHIDSAWLWPLRETVRKVARTTANMTNLLENEPDFIFAMSQAHHYAWIKEHRPEVYERVVKAVSEGRFVPTGGMWTEADTNMPSSEAMARQFVHGKRFFLDEFGVENEEAWLPDTFGFAAGLPQIIKAAGSKWLLTQKISWSKTNSFPHHTFLWEGIDGTRVFTHFPPVDTYNCSMKGREIAHAARNFKEKGSTARSSLAPTGWGDGGGGTTREMIAKAARLRDLEGSAKVEWTRPADFFAKAEAEYQDPQVWMGELYLELHRATLTTQVGTKQGNRRNENLLREAEIWAATAAVRAGHAYPYAELDRLWKEVLTHQFHDILPGSSIAWVHRETEETHAKVSAELTSIIEGAQRALAGDASSGGVVVFNAAPHSRSGVPALAAGPAEAPSGTSILSERSGGGFVLDNGVIRAEIDERGLLVSLFDHAAGRETIAPGAAGNLLQLHQDFPNAWDAWDVDKHYRHRHTDILDVSSLTPTSAPGAVSVRIERSFSGSTVTQTVTLSADSRRLDIDTEVDWHETEKFLKLAFPLDVRAERYAAETQFGHMYRPTHVNTSWEAAKFEACNHKFVHFEEPGYGVALVTESTYGHDVTRDVNEDRGTTTTVRASLVRAPKFPDPRTDQGRHRFHHALVPGATIADAVREGYRCNQLERALPGDAVVEPLATLDNEAVVISALKLSDDGRGDVVVRCYEAEGGRASALLTPGFEFTGEVEVCDLLERRTGPAEIEDGKVRLRLRPFQLVTLRFRRG
ncbi:alpha-mannosidase [Actinospica sp. MGRD01-02]|uniref:Alpha-mannosidase n=1 Tax=Actinospica acidithermotolerans TaxID=2828514 RepID=A0A941EK17_9ACTN|nr:glycoside hydrolase family 38 C-terminal domain-containing protein [Actinospica acidithermotolerans]MBR7829039.1 alpha-mannosidase [Actinospica acidithermotolerans]